MAHGLGSDIFGLMGVSDSWSGAHRLKFRVCVFGAGMAIEGSCW